MNLSLPEIYTALNLFDSWTKSVPFWLLNQVSIARVVALFPQVWCSWPQLLPQTGKQPEFVLACQTFPSCAGVLSEELSHIQKLISKPSIVVLSSVIALWSDCQMASNGLNLDSNLNSASSVCAVWPTGCRGEVCSSFVTTTVRDKSHVTPKGGVKILSDQKSKNNLCGVWILKYQNLRTVVSWYQPSSPRLGKRTFFRVSWVPEQLPGIFNVSDECKNIWNKIKEKKAGVMKQNSKVSKECAFQGSGRNFACLVFNAAGPDWDKSKQVRHDFNYFIGFRYHYQLGCWPPYPGHPSTA